jgi:hypothetical protein
MRHGYSGRVRVDPGLRNELVYDSSVSDLEAVQRILQYPRHNANCRSADLPSSAAENRLERLAEVPRRSSPRRAPEGRSSPAPSGASRDEGADPGTASDPRPPASHPVPPPRSTGRRRHVRRPHGAGRPWRVHPLDDRPTSLSPIDAGPILPTSSCAFLGFTSWAGLGQWVRPRHPANPQSDDANSEIFSHQ